ncbi:serine/threonine-protein kinase [Streptomyces cavourensis]|uniref:serine/threonine-protein kinase n=1 Tax=Streptomyces cavourensis TaxID=67258 RepID=UPI001C94E885|nr:serine/threonine-protein kinase [Streptomyces cavourensis]
MSGGRQQHGDERYTAMEGIRPLVAGDPDRIGPYPLLGRLGAGGMGRVYLARSAGGRTVAVKVVHEEHISSGEFRARFRREIETARRVGGRYTAPVLDADPDADRPWVATGYVPGPSLEQAVREHGQLPADSVHALAEGLLRALRGIHAAGIVHRDLKPSNVLLTVDGPRVIDFGIARALQVSVESLLTSTGMVIGSPGFMAPEQILGEETGTGADVFALGCVLMYAATGQLPFGNGASNQHAVMYRIVESAPDLTGVGDAPLRELIGRCLTKKPAERPGVEVLLADIGTSESPGAALRGGAWLPPQLLARLARQAAVLLDADVPGAEVAGASGAGAAGAAGAAGVVEASLARPDVATADLRPEPVGGAEVGAGDGPVRDPKAEAVRASEADPGPKGAAGAEAAPEVAPGASPAPASPPPSALVVSAGESGGKAPRRRRRMWVVAAAVLAVLATGSTVAFLQHRPGGGADGRDTDAAAPAGTGDGPSAPPSAGPTGGGEDKDDKDGKGKEKPEKEGDGDGKGQEKGETSGSGGAGEASASGGGGSGSGGSDGSAASASGGSGSGAPGGGPGSGSGAGGSGSGSGSSSGSGSGTASKPPTTDPDPPATDNRVPQHFVGTWTRASQYDALQPHTVVIRRAAPGQVAVTLIADVQGTGHCEYTAKLTSVADGGQRINVGTATVDKARSTGMCRDGDPSFYTVAGSGILHDVGPAHGSGYRYNRA